MAKPQDQIIQDIFDLTGQKVLPDDPIVAAAMMQSRIVQQAGDDAAARIERAAAAAIQAHIEIAKKKLSEATSDALRQLGDVKPGRHSNTTLLLTGLTSATLGGIACAVITYKEIQFTQEQVRLIHNGALLDKVYPTLPTQWQKEFRKSEPPINTKKDGQKPETNERGGK